MYARGSLIGESLKKSCFTHEVDFVSKESSLDGIPLAEILEPLDVLDISIPLGFKYTHNL